MAGAIPLVRALRESLAGERIHRVMGIVNGTTNFILTRMGEQGADYAEALAEAQRLGWPSATRPPTSRATTPRPRRPSWPAWPSATTWPPTTCRARASPGSGPSTSPSPTRLGYVVKLLAVVERTGDDAAVGPGPPGHGARRSHPLAGVRDAFNAVFIEGEAAGELMLYGQGAGGLPTASAVLGRPHRRRPQPAGRHHRPGAGPPAGPPAARADAAGRVLPEPRRGRPARGAGRGGHASSATTACRSARWSRRAWATRPGWSSSPTWPARATCGHAGRPGAASTWSTGSAGSCGSWGRR